MILTPSVPLWVTYFLNLMLPSLRMLAKSLLTPKISSSANPMICMAFWNVNITEHSLISASLYHISLFLLCLFLVSAYFLLVFKITFTMTKRRDKHSHTYNVDNEHIFLVIGYTTWTNKVFQLIKRECRVHVFS